MFNVGIGEMVVILLVIFILFGPGALVDMARELGKLVRNFRKSIEEFGQEISSSDEKKNDEPKRTLTNSLFRLHRIFFQGRHKEKLRTKIQKLRTNF